MPPPKGENDAGRVTVLPGRAPWRRETVPGGVLHHAGHLFNRAWPEVVQALEAADGPAAAAEVIASLDGCYGLIWEAPWGAAAAVDHIRSFPIALRVDADDAAIAPHAPDLLQDIEAAIDPVQRRLFEMSGYTRAGRTLYPEIAELKCGETAILTPGATPQRLTRHLYRPWLAPATAPSDRRADEEALTATLERVFEKCIRSLDGRPVLAPLSAGLDSRLIVSALHHFGYKDVRCFSYGLPGNYEADGARRIAERLGYPWRMVPMGARRAARHFAGERHRAYLDYADTLSNVAFVQDMAAIESLLADGYIDRDAVVINGQSGDFIAGAHIPRPFAQPGPKGRAARWERIVDALFTKHYGLWEELMDAEGRALVAEAVQEELAEDGVDLPDDPAQDYTLFELSEYRNRQAKYVVAGQRNYDMLGLDWRLPLWDLDFTAFWERQPLAHKLDESLYRETLMKLDWGGVWRDFSAPRYLSPTWIRPLRLMAKIAHAPLGVARWRRFEKRWFAYHMDVVGNYGAATPAEVRRDRGRHRNAISWHVRRYLEAKGKTS